MKSNTSKAIVYWTVLPGTIYRVLIECNNKILQSKQRNEEFMIRHIITDIQGRGSHYRNIGCRLKEHNVYPQDRSRERRIIDRVGCYNKFWSMYIQVCYFFPSFVTFTLENKILINKNQLIVFPKALAWQEHQQAHFRKL